MRSQLSRSVRGTRSPETCSHSLCKLWLPETFGAHLRMAEKGGDMALRQEGGGVGSCVPDALQDSHFFGHVETWHLPRHVNQTLLQRLSLLFIGHCSMASHHRDLDTPVLLTAYSTHHHL